VRIISFFAVPAAVLSLVALSACGSADENASPASISDGKAVNASTELDYTPIPATPAQTAGATKGLDFGTLTSITTANGVVTLHVDRSNFYIGEDATAHGAEENRDWIVKDTDGEGKELSFVLDPKASLQAEAGLRNDHDFGSNVRENLTQAQILANMTYVTKKNTANPDETETVYVWLRHADGVDGPVTAVADQFIP
jgi:hypothetical protein